MENHKARTSFCRPDASLELVRRVSGARELAGEGGGESDEGCVRIGSILLPYGAPNK